MLVDPEGEPSLTVGLLPRYREVVLTLSKFGHGFFVLKRSAIHSHTVCPMITAFRNCALAVPAPQRRPFLFTAVPRTFGLPKFPWLL